MPAPPTAQAASSLDKIDWRNLALAIESGSVIPVVGRELLVVNDDGVLVRYDQAVARRLAAKLDVLEQRNAWPGGPLIELEEVVHAHLARTPGDWPTVCTFLVEVTREYQPTVPAALEKLARMPFRLFLTTTFDDLLARALGGAAKVYELGAQRSLSDANPLPAPIPAGQRAVYHLLGRLGQAGDFPLTEEDTLEFIHKLEVKLEMQSLEIAGLRAHLERSELLVLGCGYPDWLLRIFVRTLRLHRYRDAADRRPRVAGAKATVPGSLALFFGRYNVPVFAGDLAVFVDTLDDKLRSRSSAAGTPVGRAGPTGSASVTFAHGPAERAMAGRLAARLADLGIAAQLHEWSAGGVPPDLDRCAIYAAFLSEATLREIPEVTLLEEWRAVQDRQEAQEGGPFATVMITLDAEARRRPKRPESSDWPAWPRATVRHAPPDDQIVETVARALFDAGRLPRPDTRMPLYVVASDADLPSLEQLERQLAGVRFIAVTDHREALGGTELAWRERLQRASVIAILVSPNILVAPREPAAHDTPAALELALARHRSGEAPVIPVLATPFLWRETLDPGGGPPLDPVPRRGDFLNERPNEDAAWSEAAREIAFRVQLRWLVDRAAPRKEAR